MMTERTTTPIGLLLLLPGIAALLALGLFFHTLIATSDSLYFTDNAGSLRATSQKLLYLAGNYREHPAHKSREEIRALLQSADDTLHILRHGGILRGERLDALPVLVLDEMDAAAEIWRGITNDTRSIILHPKDPESEHQGHIHTLKGHVGHFVDAVNLVLSAYDQWHRGMYDRMFLILLGVVAFDIVTMLAMRRSYAAAHDQAAKLALVNADLVLLMQERQQVERQLYLSSKVFESSGEAIIITDPHANILSVNRAFTDITGYTQEEILGQNPRILASGQHGREFYKEMWGTLLQIGYWQGEIWDRRKSGEVYPKWLGVSIVRDADGQLTHYVGIFTDISDRKATEAKIEYLALHDALTGLPNRVLMRESASQAFAHAKRLQKRVAVLFLDLDRFKTINDSLGHPVGDKLLQQIGERLRGVVRETDTVCRLGGDEFLIILGEVSELEAVYHVLENLRLRVGQIYTIEDYKLSTSFSIGVSIFPDDGEDFDTLLKNADTAAYAAKDAGRNTYRFFTEEMNDQAVARMWIETRLRQAVERREFFLEYQPQYNIRTREIIGVEALVRWQSPDLGRVAPDQFIPIAEDSGLMVEIGDWVLREACRTAADWQRQGVPPLLMAVNLSAVQFTSGRITETVTTALAESGLPAYWLELELTESLLMRDAEKVLRTVRELKALGLRLSIDDFGTGYSSLSYLKRFAVDKLKIDRTFVKDLTDNADDRAIVHAIIQMAHALNLQTIAEGVEDEIQLSYLEQAGCDEAQGFYFSRPISAAAMADLLRAPAPPAA